MDEVKANPKADEQQVRVEGAILEALRPLEVFFAYLEGSDWTCSTKPAPDPQAIGEVGLTLLFAARGRLLRSFGESEVWTLEEWVRAVR